MSITGKGDSPLNSPLVTYQGLRSGIYWGNQDSSLEVAMNNYFFGSYITKRWNGSEWVVPRLKRWTGDTWVSSNLKTWNGSEWITSQTI